MSKAQELGCHLRVQESPIHGRILEITFDVTNDSEIWMKRRLILKDEIDHHRPHYLVINLLDYDSKFAMPLVSALVASTHFLGEIGGERKTRILATGQTATELQRVIPMMRMEGILGKKVYSDLESALKHSNSSDIEQNI